MSWTIGTNIAVIIIHGAALTAFITSARQVMQHDLRNCSSLLCNLITAACFAGVVQSFIFATIHAITIAQTFNVHPTMDHPLWILFDYANALFTLMIAFSLQVYTHWTSFEDPRYDRRKRSCRVPARR